MKYIYLILVLIVIATACSNDETYIERNYPLENFFAPSADAADLESELRRDFYNSTGVYLLFNDTLASYTIPSLSGDQSVVNEIFNLGYSMTTASTRDLFTFYYYEDIDNQNRVAEFVESRILSRISDELYPFSLLLIEEMMVSKNYYGTYLAPESKKFYGGMQGCAIALGDLSNLTEEEKNSLASDILQGLIEQQIGKIPEEKFEKFYSYSKEYYNIYSWNIPQPYQSVGFLLTYLYDWGVAAFNSPEYDVKAYLNEMFALSKDEFMAKYSEYPICIEKMEELLKVLNSYGIVIYE
jgi:hypothetical protein